MQCNRIGLCCTVSAITAAAAAAAAAAAVAVAATDANGREGAVHVGPESGTEVVRLRA